MGERYTRLFSLPENLYQDGSPILISAGALLMDANTGKIIAQLKFRNISEKAIRLVKVKINAFDSNGAELNGVASFSYLDLNIKQDEEFGSQTPIILPDDAARSFNVEVVSVVFLNGEQYAPSVIAKVSPAPNCILEPVQQRELQKKQKEQLQNEKKMQNLLWVPLIVGIIVFIKFPVRIIYPNGFSRGVIGPLRHWFANDPKQVHFVIAYIFACFFVPIVSLMCNFLSKKNNSIRYVGIFVAILYSVIYVYQRRLPMRVHAYWTRFIARADGFSFQPLLYELLPIVINIASAIILFLLAKKSKERNHSPEPK